MQAAFVAHDAYQCGYCTSGQIMSAVALLKEPCGPDDAEVKELMSGNICRCGAYQNIVSRDSECAAKRHNAETGMKTFEFTRADDNTQAVSAAAKAKTAQQGADMRFIAGGTTLIDLMKLNVETPQKLIDINRLPLDKIEQSAGRRPKDWRNGPQFGSRVSSGRSQRNYAVLSQAILSGASAQLRNMATTAGNLLQRTRCMYFRDTAMPCNKREPGTGCSAITGVNRRLAILGTSEHCIATNPSDMSVALAALEATIHIRGTKGERSVPIGDFHLLPGDTPHRETVLEPGDLITHVTLPPPAPGSRSLYLKLRDRASYEFALASAAVVITVADGKLTRARIALGGVGTKPWRSPEAERELAANPRRQQFSEKRRMLRCAMPNRRARMGSRSNWPSAASCTP